MTPRSDSTDDIDTLGRPAGLLGLPLAAIVALAGALGASGMIGELPEGSMRILERSKLIDRSRRLTSVGERRAVEARDWLVTPEGSSTLEGAAQSGRSLLATLSAADTDRDVVTA